MGPRGVWLPLHFLRERGHHVQALQTLLGSEKSDHQSASKCKGSTLGHALDLRRGQVITAIMKLVAQNGSCPNRIVNLVGNFRRSQSLDVQQRCIEFQALLLHPDVMVEALPVDASCEDIDVDEHLAFLNGFVQNAFLAGAKPYSPPSHILDDDDDGNAKRSALKIAPYEMPALPVAVSNAASILPGALTALPGVSLPAGPTALGPAITNQQPAVNSSQGNQLIGTKGVQQIWGKKVEAPPPVPQVSNSSSPPPPGNATTNGSSLSSTLATAPLPTATATSAGQVEVEAKPKVLTEKEKMAKALFGGLSGEKGPTAGNRRKVQGVLATSPSSAGGTWGAGGSQHPAASITSSIAYSNEGIVLGNGSALALSPPPQPEPPSSLHIPPVNAASTTPSSSTTLLDVDSLLDTGGDVPPIAAPSGPLEMMFSNPSTTPPVVPAVHNSMLSTPIKSISDAFSDILLQAPSALSPDEGHLIRPLPIDTAEFGRRWGANPAEAKRSTSSAIVNLEQLRMAMPARYQHIESIAKSQEAIFAATHTTVGCAILVHVKIFSTRRSVDVTVKTAVADIANREATAICNSIASR